MSIDDAIGLGPRVVEEPRFSSSPFEPEDPPIERIEDINLTDPKLFLRGDPHWAWKLLREQAPVFWNKQGVRGTGGKGFWAVTSYEAINAVQRQPQVFSSSDSAFPDFLLSDVPYQLTFMDPPQHTQYRTIIQRFFTPKALKRYEEMLRTIVSFCLDTAGAEFDFHKAVAEPIPFFITCHILGLEPDDMFELGAKLKALDLGKPEAVSESADLIMNAVDEVIRRNPKGPEGSVLEAVLAGVIDGAPIKHEEVLAYVWILFIGGLDTTTHSASTGLLSLFHHPEQLDRLRHDLSLIPSAVEEILRWTSSANLLKRRVMCDTVLEGVELKEGDYTGTYFPSANRDERAFQNPYTFDVTRSSASPIMTFGWGPHVCAGQHLTRLELQVLFEILLTRYPNIEQAGPAVRTEAFSLILSPLGELPVRTG